MGKKYEIPNNIDEFLTWTYGDWRKEVKVEIIEFI